MYKWLREICDEFSLDRSNSESIVTMDNLMKFYNNRMVVETSGDEEYKMLSKEGFHCI